jgi:predicted nuclease of predicted toxin-antitoxin system
MRVLLDECMPQRLRRKLVGHEVVTAQEAGWAGKKNGELLRAATGKVDAFLTVDRNLVHQQNVKSLPFGVVVLMARNRLGDLLPLVPAILAALRSVKPGQVVRVGG